MSASGRYRAVVREFTRHTLTPKADRSPKVRQLLQDVYKQAAAKRTPEANRFERDMHVYMTSQRLHKELVERYNPTSDMTQEERAQKSARLVGLNMPKTFDPNQSQ